MPSLSNQLHVALGIDHDAPPDPTERIRKSALMAVAVQPTPCVERTRVSNARRAQPLDVIQSDQPWNHHYLRSSHGQVLARADPFRVRCLLAIANPHARNHDKRSAEHGLGRREGGGFRGCRGAALTKVCS